jgi:hypothetical protein
MHSAPRVGEHLIGARAGQPFVCLSILAYSANQAPYWA